MTKETVFSNGQIVLVDQVVHGNVVVRDKLIKEVDYGNTGTKTSIDLEGDYLLPGLIELHTDNLEKHLSPRPGMRWPTNEALLAHDSQLIAAGITSALDALAVGDIRDDSARIRDLNEVATELNTACRLNLFHADHYIHLRCEVSCNKLTEMLSPLVEKKLVRLLSVMDHTPGQRQFLDPENYKTYYAHKWGMSRSQIESFIKQQAMEGKDFSTQNRELVSSYCHNHQIPLASHDDGTLKHVEEAVRLGAKISEFPTTMDAARSANQFGLEVMVGTPNIVCGGSHSGNVSAAEIVNEGLVTMLSSDYAPISLLHGIFMLTRPAVGLSLARAVACASTTPARAVGLNDRGKIAPDLVADFVRVHILNDLPIVRGVWRNGERAA